MNVNNSEAYKVARAWKTDECTFPSWVYGHRFAVLNSSGSLGLSSRERMETVETIET
jgi:hypothetical protein